MFSVHGSAKTKANYSLRSKNNECGSQARKAAEDVEAFFLSQVFETMFAGIKTDGPFGGGNGGESISFHVNSGIRKASAKAGGFGLADRFSEILSLQRPKMNPMHEQVN